MRKTTKKWLVIAASLVVLGLILFTAVMAVNHWDFTRLSTVTYETNTYQIKEEFHNIAIMDTDTADILFAPSDDGTCKVVCYEEENAKHSAAVYDGTLTIHVTNEKKWYEYIGISFGSPKITVYLPEAEYGEVLIKESTGDVEIPQEFKFESIDISAGTGDVKCGASASEGTVIKTSTGDIHVGNASAGMFDLSVSTGEVSAQSITCEGNVKIHVSTGDTKVTDVVCKGLLSNGSTGDITLQNVTAAETFSVDRTTGDVMLDGCDAAGIFIKTTTGDVKGSLLTDKVFIPQSKTGRVDVPQTASGGRCEIATSTGDIKIEIR